jgi:ABC-type multidrug transport system ATPase subunit
VSSHILEELEKYSTHVLRMATGEVTGFDALNNYQKDHSQVLRLLFSRPALKVEETLKKQPNVSNIVLNGDWCEFVFKGKITEQSTLLMNLVNAGLPIAEMTVVKKHLQDRYLVDVSRVPPPKKVDDGLKHDEMAHIASTEHHPDPIG